MDKKKIIAEIASRHGMLIHEDDPAFYIVDIATMIIDEKAEEIRAAIGKGEESIPYLLDIKRKEIDEAAGRVLAATDALVEQREQLSFMLKKDVDNELRGRVDDYTNQVMSAIKTTIEQTVQTEMSQAAVTIQAAAKELEQARLGLRRNQLQDMLWMGAIAIVGGISALLFYVTLFQ
ncbi:hypothetical protein [Halomonas hibernica]|uniref:hypothetical protein n=1 Tax=Halomonas hibernica TaxID=2591147 RepID=UPI001553D382|nr:hypothetical protein [Halomonas hibernica]